MRDTQRRLNKLEHLPQFQPPPSLLKQIQDRAMRHISDEQLEQLIIIAADPEAGVRRTVTERELELLQAQSDALETEARRMGFRSFAQAKRNGGHRR